MSKSWSFPQNTPLSACLKVVFGLKYLKQRGVPLRLVTLPDFIIDVDVSHYSDLLLREGETKCEGFRRYRYTEAEMRRTRRAGGHAAIATLALQMLHRPCWPLFDLTYIAKTGSIGRAYMQDYLVDRLRGCGFPVDLSCTLADGQDRMSFIHNNLSDDGRVEKVFRYIQAIDPTRELHWQELLTCPGRPAEQARDADVVALFSPKARIYVEWLDHLYADNWLKSLPPNHVLLLDMTSIHLEDPNDDGRLHKEEVWVGKMLSWLREKVSPAIQRMKSLSLVPIISMGFAEATALGKYLDTDDGRPSTGRQKMRDVGDRLSAFMGCPVVCHHSVFAFVSDEAGLLVKPGEERFAPSISLDQIEIRNGGADCFNAGMVLALGVQRKLMRLTGTPTELIPTFKECMLMGTAMAAAFLSLGEHPNFWQLYGFLQNAKPLSRTRLAELLRDGRTHLDVLPEDLPTQEELHEQEDAWTTPPHSSGTGSNPITQDNPESLATFVLRLPQAAIARWRDGNGTGILDALNRILLRVWGSRQLAHGADPDTMQLPPEIIGELWEAIDNCEDNDLGHLCLSALLQGICLDWRLQSQQIQDRAGLVPPWHTEASHKFWLCLFVDLDGTVFDSYEAWQRGMRNAIAKLYCNDDPAVIDGAVRRMRKHIYDNWAFFQSWFVTECDTRQVWCRRQHLLALMAFDHLHHGQMDDFGLAAALAQASCDPTVRSNFLQSPLCAEFERAYRSFEEDPASIACVDEAVSMFNQTPLKPYLDSQEMFFWMEHILGLKLYICTEGHDDSQSDKLNRLGLFLDRNGKVRRDAILTTGAAANPEEAYRALRKAIQDRETKRRELNLRLESSGTILQRIAEERKRAPVASQVIDLGKRLVGGTLSDQHTQDIIGTCANICQVSYVELESRLRGEKQELEQALATCIREISGLEYIRGVFSLFRKKGNNPPFFARCIQAVQQDPAMPIKYLHQFLLPEQNPRQPLKLAMIGDRFSSDCKPLHDLRARLSQTAQQGRPVTTFRLLAGHYSVTEHELHCPPDQPTFVASSLTEILSILLKKKTWADMAAIEEVALFNELGTDQDAVKGLALARMVKDVPQVLRTIPQLILHQYLIQNDRTKRCFREQLVNLLKPRCLDVDLQEEIFGILQEIKEQDGE